MGMSTKAAPRKAGGTKIGFKVAKGQPVKKGGATPTYAGNVKGPNAKKFC